jgi:hypothetical protein
MIDPYHPGPPPVPPSFSEVALRVYRSLVAYGVMFACIVLLLRRPAWNLSVVDVVFWANLTLLLVLQRRAAAAGTTRESARAGLQLLAVALLLWAGAQSVQLID